MGSPPHQVGQKGRLGRLGEAVAADYLLSHGYVIRERNFRCPLGEIDIVAMEQDCLIFIEVRARQGQGFGAPEESLTRIKQRKLRQLVEYYLSAQPNSFPSYRIDVVAIDFAPEGVTQRIELIKNAIWAK
ncbi:MAG: YraN family protein [Chloroflexi bacterium]|nr:YraN family protein [Chloroflexota bacterium]MCL5074930.1 YraN family protein [Chloroflexota bacterium]